MYTRTDPWRDFFGMWGQGIDRAQGQYWQGQENQKNRDLTASEGQKQRFANWMLQKLRGQQELANIDEGGNQQRLTSAQEFGQNSRLSFQGYQQNSALSGQGYQQDLGLQRNRQDWASLEARRNFERNQWFFRNKFGTNPVTGTVELKDLANGGRSADGTPLIFPGYNTEGQVAGALGRGQNNPEPVPPYNLVTQAVQNNVLPPRMEPYRQPVQGLLDWAGIGNYTDVNSVINRNNAYNQLNQQQRYVREYSGQRSDMDYVRAAAAFRQLLLGKQDEEGN